MDVQQIHTYCAMCVSRCGVVATVEDGTLTKVSPDHEHPNGGICVKGTAAPEIVTYRTASNTPWCAPDPREIQTPVGRASPGTTRWH